MPAGAGSYCYSGQSVVLVSVGTLERAPGQQAQGSDGGSGVALAAGAIRKPTAKAVASTANAPPKARRRLLACLVLGSTG